MPRKNYDLSQEAVEYLREYKNNHPEVKSETQALEQILKDHQNHSGLDSQFQSIEEKLKKVIVATNTNDKNIQILMEVMNTRLLIDNTKMLISTSMTKSVVLEAAETEVKNRIAHAKQIKDNKQR